MKNRPTTWRVHVLVLAVYAVLSLILSWPLVAKLGTHVPGIAQWAFDESTFIWNIWTLKTALVDTLSNPLHSELIWYPLGIDLILYTYNFFHALLAQPLMLAFNLPVASNLALLFSTVFSGYGTFLLLVYLLRKLGNGSTSYGTLTDADLSGGLRRRHRLRLRQQPRHLRRPGPLRHGHDPVDPLLRAHAAAHVGWRSRGQSPSPRRRPGRRLLRLQRSGRDDHRRLFGDFYVDRAG